MAGHRFFHQTLLLCVIGNIVMVSCHFHLPLYSEITNALSSVAQARETVNEAKSFVGHHLKRMSVGLHHIKEDILKRRKALTSQIEFSSESQHGSAIKKDQMGFKKLVSDGTEPGAKMNLTQLITSQGYPYEKYTVQTEDGFLLDLHRIPHGKQSAGTHGSPFQSSPNSTTKSIVYLQHGLLASACDWVMNFQNDSLGFLLADAGYDVWMGNSRGNTFSRRHIHLSSNDDKFWDWSFDEMAKYDTKAFIDFILNKTGQAALHYVGHSQGTTMAFALFSHNPDYQRKIRLFVGLAPVTNPNHSKSPILLLSKLPDEALYLVLGRKDFLPNNFLIKLAVDAICQDKATRWLCDNILLLIVGPDTSNLNQSRLAVYMNHSPAGASVKDVIHFSQLCRDSKFSMYNYGSEAANKLHYGQPTPPVYNISTVKVPSILFSGGNDWLATPEDVKLINAQLPNVKSWYKIEKWNHLDFVWGQNAGKLCYKDILNWLPKF